MIAKISDPYPRCAYGEFLNGFSTQIFTQSEYIWKCVNIHRKGFQIILRPIYKKDRFYLRKISITRQSKYSVYSQILDVLTANF